MSPLVDAAMTAVMVGSSAALVVCAWVAVRLAREARVQRGVRTQRPGSAWLMDTASFARVVAERFDRDQKVVFRFYHSPGRHVEHTIRSVAEELHAKVVPDAGRPDDTEAVGGFAPTPPATVTPRP